MFVWSDTDPGAVGARAIWVDLSVAGPPWPMYVRDQWNEAWLDLEDVLGVTVQGVESLLSVFGSGATDPANAEIRGGPMQWDGSFTAWRVATVDGGTGTVQFQVKKNGTSMIGAGTKPAISGAAAAGAAITNWTTVTFVAGDRITIEVDGAPSGGPGETTVALGAVRA